MTTCSRTLLFLAALASTAASAQAEITVPNTAADLSRPDPAAALWKSASPEVSVMLMGQPMVVPRPATTTTSEVKVQAVHNATHLAVRLRWKDPDRSEAGRLGQFSDAAALEFPMNNDLSTPVMMGAKGLPVHLFHWRAQYQRDRDHGKPQPRDLYPNATFDMYPMEFNDPGSLSGLDEKAREQFSPGVAAGNPQSYAKTGVDEIYAEGFSTSSVQEGHQSVAEGRWENGEWTLVIVRKLAIEGGSTLSTTKRNLVAFAVWQGGENEVGSRKCLTMAWSTLSLAP